MPDAFQRTAEIRTIVGYLAEQHSNWIPSQFFGQRATAFLSPIFTRTVLQAQCNGVAAAAARLHDEVIGIGLTHHLFRLPEMLEQGVATSFSDSNFLQALKQAIASPAAAMDRLRDITNPAVAIEGAMVVDGDFGDGLEVLLQKTGGLYLDAFQRGIKTFPFVREA